MMLRWAAQASLVRRAAQVRLGACKLHDAGCLSIHPCHLYTHAKSVAYQDLLFCQAHEPGSRCPFTPLSCFHASLTPYTVSLRLCVPLFRTPGTHQPRVGRWHPCNTTLTPLFTPCREAWPSQADQIADIEKDFLPDIGDRCEVVWRWWGQRHKTAARYLAIGAVVCGRKRSARWARL